MFPHHENEIAQSECASGKPFARHWMHVRFLLVEGQKMSKSEGNFYTLRDLLLKGYRASAIRFLLLSVPYRHQLNFTFDGLTESTNAVDRLRTFAARMRGTFPAGLNADLATLSAQALAEYDAALSNDLNTAEARAAIFDLVRAGNIRRRHRHAARRKRHCDSRDSRTLRRRLRRPRRSRRRDHPRRARVGRTRRPHR